MILMLQIFDVTANENACYKCNELDCVISDIHGNGDAHPVDLIYMKVDIQPKQSNMSYQIYFRQKEIFKNITFQIKLSLEHFQISLAMGTSTL